MSQKALRFQLVTASFFRWSVGIIGAVLLGVIGFEMLEISIFKRIGMPHEFCYQQDLKLIWLHVISDGLIGTAYVSISCILAFLVYRGSKGIPFNWVFVAFGLFIVSCGFTHFMEIWVIWEPVYWMSGYIKAITAAASVATAIALVPLIPKVFALVDAARKGEARRREVEQLNQELERFNYSVAHDLRAPLRGIAGFSHVLQEDYGPGLPPKARQHLDHIRSSVRRMDELLNDLLRYSMIGRQELQLTPVPLDEPIRRAIDLIEAQIKEVDGAIVLPDALPVVQGDVALLQVVFQNLFANSLKFVAQGVRPRIEVSTTKDAAHVTVWVTDNGIGIPEHARDKLFRMFERFNPGYPGTGMGLAIVHRAIERMNGKVGSSPGPRDGAQFWLQLPGA